MDMLLLSSKVVQYVMSRLINERVYVRIYDVSDNVFVISIYNRFHIPWLGTATPSTLSGSDEKGMHVASYFFHMFVYHISYQDR